MSWNTRTLLEACLRSLRADAQSGFADVWVVDNASADGSADLVSREFPWVSIIRSSENMGFGAAVNVVAARTATPWIVAANADTKVAAGALSLLVNEGKEHPNVGALAPRLVLPDGTTQLSTYPFPTIPFTIMYFLGASRLWQRLTRGGSANSGDAAETEGTVPWAVGAFLLLRRRAWDEVGGFDDAQWMYAEDLDLGWRLHRNGWKTRYVPRAVVVHDESAATKQAWGGDRFARWHASTYAWLMRRRGLRMARLLAALNITGFGLRVVAYTPPALAGSVRARQARQNAFNAVRAHSAGLRRRSWLEQVR